MRPALPLSVALALVAVPSAGWPQGTVQVRGERRPAPLQPEAGCDLWTGFIPGNDPTAEATVQLCTRDHAVAGIFLWSSLQAGWARRRFEGTWNPARTRLTLRDTDMLDNHPARGWTLCRADLYALRPTAPGRLEGEYFSRDCRDHGTLTLVLQGPVPPAASPEDSGTPTPNDRPRAALPRPSERGSMALRCTAGHGPTPAGPWGPTLWTIAAMVGWGMGRRRGRRADQPEPRLARP